MDGNVSVTDIPETQYAQSGDLSIAYQVIGDGGGTDIVFASGFISHIELQWELPFASPVHPLAQCGVPDEWAVLEVV
jgi:hypothetical protein